LQEESFDARRIPTELEYKVKKCFVKLFKILSSKKLTLYKTFSAYDTDKSGELTINEFEKIIKRLDSSFR
jgi:Ca2+-binding EF-hand superfamily protein